MLSALQLSVQILSWGQVHSCIPFLHVFSLITVKNMLATYWHILYFLQGQEFFRLHRFGTQRARGGKEINECLREKERERSERVGENLCLWVWVHLCVWLSAYAGFVCMSLCVWLSTYAGFVCMSVCVYLWERVCVCGTKGRALDHRGLERAVRQRQRFNYFLEESRGCWKAGIRCLFLRAGLSWQAPGLSCAKRSQRQGEGIPPGSTQQRDS